ncbi:enoyl-ACP reductase FabI [Marinococcus halotolerans]|uniref:enoyl-ACP reductase FabI n=1 Tax=Marinococcus halotolerans TaxID=301092 RepID=UPI0003B3C0A6|nr:enoyl-ACP reductase FabI [Marinococcus halotolerans]
MQLSLKGKTFVVMGVANKRSIAWGAAESLAEAGADLVFTYGQQRTEKSVRKLADSLDQQEPLVVQCDVTNDEQIRECFAKIKEEAGTIHGVVHSLAYAKREELEGEYLNATREGFLLAQEISAYSFTAVAKAVKEFDLMTEGGSFVTMSYLGAERIVNNYNVMGVAKASLEASTRYLANDLGADDIRVNAISAGPIRTLAAKGVSGFNDTIKAMEEHAPLRRTVTQKEVGDTTAFLMSGMSSGITGEVIHVDGGYHAYGM